MTRSPTSVPVELLTCDRMARADAWAIGLGTPGTVLMARAGRAVAQALMARWSRRPVLVLCGPGNNGGDGWVVARLLHQAGWPVRVATSIPIDGLRGDAHEHALRWLALPAAAALTVALDEVSFEGVEVVVDALFGAGLDRPLAPDVTRVLSQVALRRIPVLAVDVPSGLQGDTGRHWGAVAAQCTVTFFRKKPGHVLMPGRSLCGEVVVADIGIDEAALELLQVRDRENDPALWMHHWPRPDVQAHKYRRGKALAFGGARMVGAAWLSVRAAARIGAGLTLLAVPASAWAIHAGRAVSTMVEPVDDGSATQMLDAWSRLLRSLRWSTLLLGPGAQAGLPGDAPEVLRQMVRLALAQAGERPVVLDADALSAFEGRLDDLAAAVGQAGGPVVLTPHEGEFNRLFGTDDADKLTRTREAARRSGCVVVHKGADTVIAQPDGRCIVNARAPVWLATAGSGDVLAGFITGLLAQGMPAGSAAAAAVWVHGVAGERCGPGLVAEDLPEAAPAVWAGLIGHGPG